MVHPHNKAARAPLGGKNTVDAKMTLNLGGRRCRFARSERINTGWKVNLCQYLDSVGFLKRMLQKPICLLLVLSPLIFGQEFFGCCPLKEVQGTWMVDMCGDFIDDVRTIVNPWMVEAVMMVSSTRMMFEWKLLLLHR